MFNPSQRPPWMFDLEGTVLGFPNHKPTKVKYIALEVEQEQVMVTLPKELRHPRRLNLQPGCRVRCIGCSRLDLKEKTIELKAYQVLRLTPGPECTLPMPTVALPSLPSSLPPSSKANKEIKILVCHKSDCQKRGGRKLITALEQALVDRNLQDQVTIKYTGCQKRCSKGPSFTVMPGKYRYDRVSLKDLPALLDELFCVSP